MSASDSMRQLINRISVCEDPFVIFCTEINQSSMLLESTALSEGAILDRIRKTTKAVKDKYDDVQYSLLSKATTRAMDMFNSSGKMDPKVGAVLTKIGKMGKAAAANRTLILVLVGMVGTLIGLASNPAAAQSAAAQMDQSLSGNIDQLVNTVTGGSGGDVAAAQTAANPNTIQNVLQFNATRVPSTNGAINLERIAMQDETGVIGGRQRWQRFTDVINDNQGRLTSYTRNSPEVMNAVSRAVAENPMPNISNYQIDATLRNPEGFQRYTTDVTTYFHNLTRFAKATLERNEDVAQMAMNRLQSLRR